jgi:hypothetical protein
MHAPPPPDWTDDDEDGGKDKGDGKGGSSCHQCKSRRNFIALTYCTSKLDKKNKRCRKKFCGHCLRKFYKESAEMLDKNTWRCPSCRKICCCAACKRRKTKETGTGESVDSIAPKSTFPKKKKENSQARAANFQQQMPSVPNMMPVAWGNTADLPRHLDDSNPFGDHSLNDVSNSDDEAKPEEPSAATALAGLSLPNAKFAHIFLGEWIKKNVQEAIDSNHTTPFARLYRIWKENEGVHARVSQTVNRADLPQAHKVEIVANQLRSAEADLLRTEEKHQVETDQLHTSLVALQMAHGSSDREILHQSPQTHFGMHFSHGMTTSP